MKRLLSLYLNLILASSAFAYSPQTEFQIMTLEKPSIEGITELLNGKSSQFVLECREGTILPMTIEVKGEYFALLSEQEVKQKFIVLKTFYLRFVDETFFFSHDLQSWKEYGDFFQGSFGVGLHDGDDSTQLTTSLELNSKE